MTERLVKISSLIQNQLPEFIRDEFPLVQEFLKSYYSSVENPGGPVDVIQNIDKYIKVDNILPIQEETVTTQNVSFFDNTIFVETTYGFPDSYGLLQIGDEIISYTSKTSTSFEGCIRGFSGTTALSNPSNPDELVFESSNTSEHSTGDVVKNLSILFLKEFLTKIKKQVTPGFDERSLYRDVNDRLFIKQSKDFYKSKGTDSSFKILFYALYGTKVDVIKPRDYLIQPSTAQYRITKDIVAELVSGNPDEVVNGTLYQDADDFFPGARGTITHVEYISRNGKDYYLLKLDYDYNKDIDVAGTIKSQFSINPKTLVTSNITSGASYIDVDSTVGFPPSGELVLDLDNGTQLIVTYQSKTLNQFFECSGINQDIPSGKEVKLNKYVYGFSNKNREQQVRFRITGVLEDLELLDVPYLYSKDDTIQIKTLGSDIKDVRANAWFFNVPTRYNVEKIERLDSSDFTYKATLFDEHSFVIGDNFTLVSSFGEEFFGRIVFVDDKKIVTIRSQRELDNAPTYTIKKNVSKVDIANQPELNYYNSNVQNVYYDLKDSYYVTSPSLPTYLDQALQINDQTVVFSGSFNGIDLSLQNESGIPLSHSFFTGESVVYRPGNTASPITTFGVYFVERIDKNTLRLARSREDLYNEKYVTLSGTAVNDRLELFEFNDSNLELQVVGPQGLIRKLQDPVNDGGSYETSPGPTGIFVNGVELLNYKSKNQIFFGPIEEISATSGGSGYNVITPPNLIITDDTGSNCTAYCSVTGKLEKIDVLDPGFDYLDTPVVTIKGGNGSGARAKVNLVSYEHNESFNAATNVNVSSNSIQFPEYHKFRDYEEVIYDADGNTSIGGLVSRSSYFISVQDAYTIKLHKTQTEAVSATNPINLTSVGNGIHLFKSKQKKRRVGSVEIENGGLNYKNHKTFVSAVGINTATDVITIKNHRYNSGELIRYSTTGSSVGGLSTTASYYVTKVNEDQFKLSLVSTGENPEFYYRTKQYINLTSTGSGSHYFNYEPIEVKIEGRIGIATVGSEDFSAVLQPVFRGEIDSVYVENGGLNYGAEDILNFNKQPKFTVNAGFGAQLKPVISNGRVVSIIIQSSGSNYESIPDLVVNGTGQGCILTPVLSNGTIVEVKVISSGLGYEADTTTVDVVPYGTGAKFEARIRSWRVNLVEKNLITESIPADDGEIYSGISNQFGLQYSHLYASRALRASVLATRFDSGQTFFSKDLQVVSGREVISNAHSPIIGWAYDGNPIYGPYGFSGPTGGSIRSLKSGYSLKANSKLSQENRPSLTQYPAGFFVEDYEYTSTGDLDEYNGRFTVTPEFPNGVYAYFSTINPESVESSGSFKNYRKPVFPYVVGNSYRSRPIEYNFDPQSNQSNIDLNKVNWVRNTTPYNVLNLKSGYDYFINPNESRKQLTDIKNTLKGSVDSINIIHRGENYKIADSVIFENQNTGRNIKAEVSKLQGSKIKNISVQQFEIDNVQLFSQGTFVGIKTEASYLRDNDIVRITTPYEYNREARVTIQSPVKLSLSVGIGSTVATGIITYFNVSGVENQNFYENDLFEIGNEVVKVLVIDRNKNRLLVQRNVDSYVGLTSYTSGTILTEKSNKFVTNIGITTGYDLSRERQLYFSSNGVLGLGATFGVGISSTLFLNVNNVSSQVAIGTGSTTTLYFDRTSEVSRYSFGSYIQLANSSNSSFDVDKAKVVGLGNTFIVVDFNSSALSGIGVTSYVNIWNTLTIPTRTVLLENHNLSLNDKVQYIPPANGTGIGVIDPNNPLVSYTLPTDTEFFVYPVTSSLIGISTIVIDSNSDINQTNLLMFDTPGTNNLSTGDIHSFKLLLDNPLTVKLVKNQVTVETETPHNLELGDFVDVYCQSGISTTLHVKYNDNNRRVVIGERSFISGNVNTANNSIRIQNHGFRNGEKVIHTSTVPSGGLQNQKIYYVFVEDENTIRFTESYYETQVTRPNFVNITSASFGTIHKINPQIKVTKYSTLKFDLSDSSLSFTKNNVKYPAFEFSFYTDPDFKNKFVSSQTSNRFEVRVNGTVGVSTNAFVEISFNENVPSTLYYKITPIDINNNTISKLEAIVDDEQYEYNKITLVDSKYSGKYRVVDTDPNPYTFKYTIFDYPERPQYSENDGLLRYVTDSKSASGAIEEVTLISRGKEYSSLPSIGGIQSENGFGAVLEPLSQSIGLVNTYEIKDIGFDYSVDSTIRPKAKLPEIVKVEPLSVIGGIGVTFIGVNYSESPDLVVLDGVSKEVITDIILDYSITDKSVSIIKNTDGINNVSPIIIPINNTNGYQIKSIAFNPNSKDVTLELDKEFSDPEDFPFEVGKRVLIENVSVASTNKGYNSANYNYALFTITSLDANIGGIGATISYSLSSYLSDGEVPGTYDTSVLKGIVVPESHFPLFDVSLTKRSFASQELVVSSNAVGNVESWDENNEILKITTSQDFVVGSTITGQTSKTKAIIKEIKSFDAFYKIGSSSIVKSGWNDEVGFLNNEFQRLHDSDYYQYFSYSLKSNVSFDKWKEPVEALNHTAGFKKFSDLVVESTPATSGISTTQSFSDFSGLTDFYSVINTHCVNDYDLVRENSITLDGKVKSNEIYFETKVLQDYIESFGNRVLMIDDISGQFNSNPRATAFSVIDEFDLAANRYRKYFIHCIDKRFTNNSEGTIVSLLHDGTNGYLNQYGKISTDGILGDFDFSIFGTQGNLLFYPIKFEINNYDLNLFSFNISDALNGAAQINLGDVAQVRSYSHTIAANDTNPNSIISIGSSFRAFKAIVQVATVDDSLYEVNELNLVHDGTDVYMTEYGQLNAGISTVGFGTYGAYISGGNVIIDVTANVGYASSVVINSLVIPISNEVSTGIGTTTVNNNKLISNAVSIAASTSPTVNTIATIPDDYTFSYTVVSVANTSANQYQVCEMLTLYNGTNDEVYYTEFGSVETDDSLGTLSAAVVGNNVNLLFTPNANIACDVRLFSLNLGKTDDIVSLELGNTSISVSYGFYVGTRNDVKKSFDLTHKNLPIFERSFDSEDSSIVNLTNNTIRIPQNFFVTGEEVLYSYDENDSPIGIQTTSISGIGTTDKLPGSLYIIKLNDLDVQVAASASLALSVPPVPLDINQLGIGTVHKFIAKKQNTKCLISIDNIIQSPIAGSATTTTLAENVGLFDGQIKVNSIESLYGGDMIQVNNEIMKIVSVGIGSTNILAVDRELLGSGLSTHFSGDSLSKVDGNYNIVDNVIYFSEAPYGDIPLLNIANRQDEVDYEGLEVNSSFSGRVFLRSGTPNTSLESYSYNYVFDDISNEFTGYDDDFNLKSQSHNVVGISTGNAVVLINNIFQLPERNDGAVLIQGNYDLDEVAGITTLSFVGSQVSNPDDVNTTGLPRGGIIVSIGSTQGFGYQPLVSAGGTAIVSAAGTIQSISIGSSGAGYRSGIQTYIQVGVQTESTRIPNIEYIGIASVLNGNVVSVAITNPGIGYTFTNPPVVVFDEPLSYFNIPLVYSNTSSGIGTGAVIDVVVGQGSSVISFELKNTGYGYQRGDVLTVGYGGTVGIPTNTSVPFNEFQIIIDEVENDNFSGWSFGDLQVLDPIDDLFDGVRKSFPLRLNGLPKTIRSRAGSNIDVQATLLVFINDVLQVPGEAYTFTGGSIITFKEAPKGDVDGIEGTKDASKILFYRGTTDVDTANVDILETVKVGDRLTIDNDDYTFQQTERLVEEIKSTDIVGTNLYSKFGISQNESLVRSVNWCRQTEDLFINGEQITKDRILYEPLIQPSTIIIKAIEDDSTEIFVENVKTFFDNFSEDTTDNDKIIVTSQKTLVSAAATALVSIAGTISSIILSDGGGGYESNPTVSISNPINNGTRASATASATSGIVTNFNIVNPGIGYTFTNPPQVLIESPNPKFEIIDNVSYEGDFGQVIGIKTTSVGVASTGIVFDFFIPQDSFLRNLDVNNVGVATTGISGIQTGYYFSIQDSNIGFGLTSLDSNGNVIGIGTTFIDNVYQAAAVSIGSTIAPGIGTTTVVQVTVSVSSYNNLSGVGFSEFYGNYSWGRIHNLTRSNAQNFDIESGAVVQRYSPLKYRDYSS